jgi:hypothetical protein
MYTLENLSINSIEKINLITERKYYSTKDIRAMFPDASKIYVLDFSVVDTELPRFLGPNGEILGYIDSENNVTIIDHHSDHPQFEESISATHQALIAVSNGLRLSDKDIIILNHTDTDSILSTIILTNPDLSDLLKARFALATVNADHSGGEDDIVDLIDTVYRKRDPELSINTLEKYLKYGTLEVLSQEIRDAYHERVEYRMRAKEVVKSGQLQHAGNGVYFIKTTEDLQSLHFPAYCRKYEIPLSVIIIAKPKNGKWAMSIRTSDCFPKNTNLLKLFSDLNLGKYGFGGRNKAGGNSRIIDNVETIEVEDLAQMIAEYLATQK